MEIKSIVFDLDGTVLNKEHQISPRTREAIIKVQEAGIKVILASGRPTASMMWIAHELELEKHHGLLVSFNGACVVDVQSEEVLYTQPIKEDVASELLNHLKKFDVIPMVYHEEYMYVNDVYKKIEVGDIFNRGETAVNIIEYESRNGKYKVCEIDDLEAFVDFPLYKVLIAADTEYLSTEYIKIKEPLEDDLNCVFSAPFYFEFTDKNIDKANTLEKVLATLEQDSSTLMAFGDGHNDKSMIEYAEIGIAMGNAEEEVLAVADEITLSNGEDGIAVSLEKHLPHIFG